MNNLWSVLLLILLIVGCGCSKPYSEYYHDMVKGGDTSNIIFTTEEPILHKGSILQEDNIKMLEDGYVLLGYSSFTGPEQNVNQAIEQAKKIKASVVVVYSKYIDTKSGIRPIVLPDIKTSVSRAQSTVYGSAIGSGGYASGSATAYGTGTTTTYGTKTIYKPYIIDRFEQGATYWVKIKGVLLGIMTQELTPDLRQKIGSNKGLLVIAVVKQSPAFLVDILQGDIIKQINNIDILDNKHFLQTLISNANKKVTITLLRNGEEIIKDVKLNSIPEGVNIPK